MQPTFFVDGGVGYSHASNSQESAIGGGLGLKANTDWFNFDINASRALYTSKSDYWDRPESDDWIVKWSLALKPF